MQDIASKQAVAMSEAYPVTSLPRYGERRSSVLDNEGNDELTEAAAVVVAVNEATISVNVVADEESRADEVNTAPAEPTKPV